MRRRRGEGRSPHPHQVGRPSFGQVTCLHMFAEVDGMMNSRGIEEWVIAVTMTSGKMTL